MKRLTGNTLVREIDHENHLWGAYAFYRDDLPIEIPENLTTEAYTTYWGRCGERLASLGAFSYTRTLLPALIKVGRYTSIADRLQVLGDRHPLELSLIHI